MNYFLLSPNLAKLYSSALRKAADIPVDVGDKIEMSLPDFADEERIKRWIEMSPQEWIRKY